MKVAKRVHLKSPNQLAADGLVNHTVDANSFLSYFQSIFGPEQPLLVTPLTSILQEVSVEQSHRYITGGA